MEYAKYGANQSDIEYYISEPEQKRPKDFGTKMDSSKFKRALLHFLVNDWQMNTYCDQLRGHRLYIGLENQA